MKTIRLFLPVFALLLLACNALSQPLSFLITPTPTLRPTQPANLSLDCPDIHPSQKEIDFGSQYKDEIFEEPDWKSSYTVMDYRVRKTWENKALDAVVNMDHIIFCGATDASLDDYYTVGNFNLIFQNYVSYEHQQDCRDGNMRLYELKVNYQGTDYNARFWVELVDGDHTRETLVVFPIADVKNFDSYSEKLMPELPSCQ